MQAGIDQHPITLVNNDDLNRNRLTVFFRLLLVIPHAIWLMLWGIAVYIAVFVAWLVAIFTAKVPDGLHNFIASYLRYLTHVRAYMLLVADPYPGFSGGAYPVDLNIAPADRQSRLTIFFRSLLAIPALILSYVFGIVNNAIAFLGWFYALFTGRMSEGMRNLSAWMLKYEAQTYGYLMLVTGKYPSMSGAPSA